MKVKGFLKDVTGASRVTKARLNAFESASATPETVDPIAEVVKQWHPGKLDLIVSEVRAVSKTAKTIRFEKVSGGKLPFFYAGQFIVLDFRSANPLSPVLTPSAPHRIRQGWTKVL